ncbi:MAG: AAA domain-containing protein [Deltaproteobacteria bacterium]|nr:AAA domain-containing protein [Myxococcales bacterium]MDP3213673.1 AAA domain-containing protein [Deltaproteobacteria bacterium]
MSRFYLSPSRVARYFFHECDRHLRHHATPRARRAAEGVPDVALERNPITAAVFEGGFRWEERVVGTLLRGRAVVAPASGTSLRDRTFDVPGTLAALRALAPGELLYQPTLAAPPSFLARYGLDPALVDFAPCRPDLIEYVPADERGPARLRVIDVKASDALKASHRIQVTLYALLLREVLAHADIPVPVDLDEAAIWLFAQPRPERFPLSLTVGVVEEFLRDRVSAVLSAPKDDVAWHLFYRCEWCEFYQPCRAEADAARSVSLIPYLSVGGRTHLREARWAGGAPIHTLEALGEHLADDAEGRTLDDCGSLRGRRDRLLNAVDALVQQRVVPHGGSSIRLPKGEDVRLLVTLQTEPLGGRVYAAGFLRLWGGALYPQSTRAAVFVAASPDDCDRVRQDFLRALHAEMLVVHRHNAATADWAGQRSLQTFVFDTYEDAHLHDLLFEGLADPATQREALELLFHFQNEGVVQAKEQPGTEVPFPVVVLTSVLRELVALPAPVAFHLADVLAALPDPRYAFTYERHGLFDFQLSNALKSDAIFMAWNDGRAEAVTWVHDRLVTRLRAVGHVVDGLRAAVSERLFAWPPRFRFPQRIDLAHVELSRVAFVTRYESLVGALECRGSRTRPQAERERDGTRIPLEHLGAGRWRVGSTLDDSLVDDDDFWGHLLAPDTESGERAQMAYDDYRRRRDLFSPRGEVEVCNLVDKTVDPLTGLVTEITLHRGGPSVHLAEPAPGARRALHPRTVDFISDRIVARLQELDADPASDFLSLVRSPRDFAAAVAEPADFLHAVAQESARPGLTPSQTAAFDHLVARRLTLVWGPPGTGKTHFLAQAILRLARARAATGSALRVVVAAFTHAAIENLLAGVAAHLKSAEAPPSLRVLKFGEPRSPKGASLPFVTQHTASTLNRAAVVVGSTVHGLRKLLEGGAKPFELLIIDEASQMKLGELALASAALAGAGRLVLAGDDLQLPPIIKGRYPAADDGLPAVHDSAFAYLRARQDPARPFTWQLVENWRMNATLSRFSAETLYSRSYRPADATIGAQALVLAAPTVAPTTALDALVEYALDPAYPLVVCVSDGVRAAVENRVEASLVAALAVALRERMHNPVKGRPYRAGTKGDTAFWRRGLFIVSPHHAQIRAIRRALAARRGWRHPPFVDTVDKMQGQEALAVLVSYGVSDAETAAQEAAFIYSLPRLNVSLSRARAKCVVFLPRALLEPSFEVMTRPDAARGLAHMHALIAFAREHGASEVFPLDGAEGGAGATLTVLRGALREGAAPRSG